METNGNKQIAFLEADGSITDDNVFVFPAEKELGIKDLEAFVNYHRNQLLGHYQENKNYYEGKHPILSTSKMNDLNRPNNKLVVNFPKYIVDTMNGFFDGIPIKIDHEDETVDTAVTEFNRRTNADDKFRETTKTTLIEGQSFLYVYQDENQQTQFTKLSPINAFMIYDDSVEPKELALVRYASVANLKITGELITNSEIKKFERSESGSLEFTDSKLHLFGEVPAVEVPFNDERQAIFETVKSLINAVDKALSAKANDVDYFADAYLAITGAHLSQETIDTIKKNRLIVVKGDGAQDVNIEFLAKPDADTTQENLINRLIDMIYQMSMVANINDDSFGNASGVSLEFKLLPMKNLAVSLSSKFTQVLRKFYRLAFKLNDDVSDKDAWQQLTFKYTQNIPRNIAEEAQTANTLLNVTSRRTAISALSMVDDPEKEMESIEKENDESRKNAVNSGLSFGFANQEDERPIEERVEESEEVKPSEAP